MNPQKARKSNKAIWAINSMLDVISKLLSFDCRIVFFSSALRGGYRVQLDSCLIIWSITDTIPLRTRMTSIVEIIKIRLRVKFLNLERIARIRYNPKKTKINRSNKKWLFAMTKYVSWIFISRVAFPLNPSIPKIKVKMIRIGIIVPANQNISFLFKFWSKNCNYTLSTTCFIKHKLKIILYMKFPTNTHVITFVFWNRITPSVWSLATPPENTRPARPCGLAAFCLCKPLRKQVLGCRITPSAWSLATPPENANPVPAIRGDRFVFHLSLQTQAPDAVLKNKTPQLFVAGFAL